MNNDANILKLVEISRLYYERNLTQAEIPERMNISRPAVSKLLSEARVRGLVKIEIKSPLMSDDSLLGELNSAYNLKGGLIVPSGFTDEEVTIQLLVSQAAMYFEKMLSDVTKVGVGWGVTMGRLVDEMKNYSAYAQRTGYVCPVIGSAHNDIKWFQNPEGAIYVSSFA